MDGQRFDDITRALVATGTRRGVLRALVGATLGLGLAGRRVVPATASHCPAGTTECGGGTAPCCSTGYSCCPGPTGDEFCCNDATQYCDPGHCACVANGRYCCEGTIGTNRVTCPSDATCCRLDTGNVTCCAPGSVCDPTWTCRLSCPPERVRCGNFCCRTGETCDLATDTCVPACLPANTCGSDCCDPNAAEQCCGSQCVDVSTDEANCGNCDNACPLGATCLGGACACPTGQTDCDGRCVEPAICTGGGDTTPPEFTLPGSVTVDATSPAGAAVAFAVSAQDDADGPVTPACSPASGDVFPIGMTTVTCTATDAAGNLASDSFDVVVRGAAAQLDDLIAAVLQLNAKNGIVNSLDAKLANAQDVLADASAGDPGSACGKLGAFIHEVEAQAGGQIEAADAQALLTAAYRIAAVLGC